MNEPVMGIDRIKDILPHRSPFLFVDRVVSFHPERGIVAERDLRADEPQFAGHFPGRPIMPGVLVAEALAQASGLLLALLATGEDPAGRMFYLARADMKWTEPAVPGDTLVLESKVEKSLGRLVSFRVRAYTRRKDVATGSLTLARVT